MAGNPLQPQGNLNRVRGSVVVPALPNLNVTSVFLGKAGIRLAFQGNATPMIDAMTGRVTSPEPYLGVMVTINLLRTLSLGQLWRAQMESTSLLGQVTVIADSSNWPEYDFVNCAIESVHDFPLDGTDPGYVVVVSGTYPINNNLFNLQ
jgi:hypothetical protein